ncbi:UNVERIFIED_CONTAM: hypothetical protein Sangu_2621300 [Sesamum angustifolium]|uniref:G-patch domain-containing protein n=1 Tax=Sesamum angustifolium TaxID=2727405 RepID=A0AAW2J5D4_9LAMI
MTSGVEGPPVQELRRNKEKQEVKKWDKPFSKAQSKESMAVNVAPFKPKSTGKDNVASRNNVPYEKLQRKLTLKEMQAREYPFLDSDVPRIFDDLLEANLIDLPEIKRPEEAERKDDPKYCKYHRLIGHAIQDCFVFKDKIMQLARQGICALNQEEEGGQEALAIDEKGFDPKAFKLLIKAGYDPKEKLNLGKLPPEATGKKLHGLNATQIMLKKRTCNSRFSNHKREENLRESIFNRLGPHRKELHGITNRQSVFDRLCLCKRVRHQKKKSEVEEEDAEDALAELEEGIKATIDKLKEVNLGDIENPRPIYISASLTHGEDETYIALLHEFKDVFAWSYKEMPGLDLKVALHHLSVKKGARPVKQGQRRFRPELIPVIQGEVNKLIEVGFI